MFCSNEEESKKGRFIVVLLICKGIIQFTNKYFALKGFEEPPPITLKTKQLRSIY